MPAAFLTISALLPNSLSLPLILSSFQITPSLNSIAEPLTPEILLQVHNPTPRPILFRVSGTSKVLGPFHYQSQPAEVEGGSSFCWQACGKWSCFSGDLELDSDLIFLIIHGGEMLLFDHDYTLAYSESRSTVSSKPLCVRHSSARPFEMYYHIWSSQDIWRGEKGGRLWQHCEKSKSS